MNKLNFYFPGPRKGWIWISWPILPGLPAGPRGLTNLWPGGAGVKKTAENIKIYFNFIRTKVNCMTKSIRFDFSKL